MHLDKNQSSADLSQKVMSVLQAQDKAAELRRVEFVGPQVGRELAEYGALALLVTAAGIVLYASGCASVALRPVRDHREPARRRDHPGLFRLLPVGVLAPVLAAVLAVLGYSVNESVIVFDRVRTSARCKASTAEVIDAAITSTISRTIITHGSTQVMATTMLFFGGPARTASARAHHRHPVRHLLVGTRGGPLVMWLGARREQFIVAGKRKTTGPRERGRRRRLAT